MTGTTALHADGQRHRPERAPGHQSSITLEFTVGYGGNIAPTGTPTLTVNGSTTGVGAVTCKLKAGHNNCTATYNPSSLRAGRLHHHSHPACGRHPLCPDLRHSDPHRDGSSASVLRQARSGLYAHPNNTCSSLRVRRHGSFRDHGATRASRGAVPGHPQP